MELSIEKLVEAGFVKMVEAEDCIEFSAPPKGHPMFAKDRLRFIQRKSGMWFSEVKGERGWEAVRGQFCQAKVAEETFDWLKTVGRGFFGIQVDKL